MGLAGESKIEHLDDDISYWQKTHSLEKGRNEVLRMVARNEGLQATLNKLCFNAQVYNDELLCSVLRFNEEEQTLHPIASVSLPDFYCDALEGVKIGAAVGSCGRAAFLKKRVIVEDINTHPYWNQYKELALSAGVQSCWSEPILGPEGQVYGTFAIYYRIPKKPSEQDLQFIELSANLAAVVFENQSNRYKLVSANLQLSQTIDKRNEQLEQANRALEESLKQQNQHFSENLNEEKMQTTNSLLSGFSHEISTPIGTALTAIGVAEDKLKRLDEEFNSGQLTRNSFVNKVGELNDIVELNKMSLQRATALLSRFKDINASSTLDLVSDFSFDTFLKEIQVSLSSLIGEHTFEYSGGDVSMKCAKSTLWQVLYNLIENSVEHGFTENKAGEIYINIIEDGDDILMHYQDNGIGIQAEQTSKVFEPFYTSNRNQKNIGLGLNIVNNLITHTLQGRISLINTPVGVRYDIRLPKEQINCAK